ncbi:uncharacterized protein LOC107435093 [Ziziphus jujuba]|uniref:Uncharacterized protein LOC107435093 n=1 Tax=Ziziphus jujuba TaxID=326968 RepID=A0A6P4BGJ3_ZIZJJ|nr:uncharacterized protein LOC107435093 [Ziziphus jujuba]
MQMERERHNVNGIRSYSEFCCDYGGYGVDQERDNGRNIYPSNSMSSPSSSSSSSSATLLPVSLPPLPPASPPLPPGVGYIQHPVSKLDTLAGVAIKYGVEVADIKKLNGLVTDLQMFALKSLQIPLPGRHPPSPCLSNGSSTPGQSSSDRISTQSMHRDLFESFQSLRVGSSPRHVSSAMCSLQGYYGLKPAEQSCKSKEFDMGTYRKGTASYLEDKLLPRTTNPPLQRHRKSKSMVNGFFDENGMADVTHVTEVREGDSDRWSEKLVRRRQKSEADFSRTPELLLEDNSCNSGFSPITGKRLAPRPKAASRTTLATDVETTGLNPLPVSFGDSFLPDGFFGVRKSSSTSNLQDQESNSSASIWSTSKWNLKPDLQAFSTVGIGRPIFDGLPKPITGRRSKAALD